MIKKLTANVFSKGTYKDKYLEFLEQKVMQDFNIREQVVIDYLGGKPVEGQHGWDGVKDGVYLEVKSTTYNGKTRLNLQSIFSNMSTKSVQKYYDIGKYVAFVINKEGKALLVLTFDMKHLTPIFETYLSNENRTHKLNIHHTSFPEEFNIEYFNESVDIDKCFVAPLAEKLRANLNK